jgi:aminoglycoside phosphotransferase
MSGSEAWVFMLGGDLIVGVIDLTTLGLAYLHIELATLGLAYLHISLSFSGLVS